MISGIGRASRPSIPGFALIAIAAFAMVIAGCDGDTPTGPIDQAETARITRTAIDDTLGAVGGTVFNDMNQNKVMDDGEPGLEGLTVTLADPTGKTQGAKTDADGKYLFDDLEPAIYIVTAPVVEGWTSTTPLNATVKVNEAELATIDHGLYTEDTGGDMGSITGIVFNDKNKNGEMDDGEMGLEGLTVGVIDPDGKTEGVKTGLDGRYGFADLLPGTYKVVGPEVEGWMLTTADSVEVKVIADVTAEVDFGLYREAAIDRGSIAGTVFDDMNKNGVMDDGEMGLGALTVTLNLPDETTREATTDENGDYAFNGLSMGAYSVIGPIVEDWVPSTPVKQVVTLAMDEAVTGIDFGLYMGDMGSDFATIDGRIFEDLDHDGMWDEGEPGIAGVKVRLSSRNNPRSHDTKKGCGIHRYAMSGEDGTYVFEEVRPGSWRVKPSKPHGYHRSSAKDLCVDVMAGEVVDDANFGFVMRKDKCDDDDDDDDDDD